MTTEDLIIRNVYLRNFKQEINKDFHPGLDTPTIMTQSKRGYGDGCSITEYKTDEKSPPFYIYRFEYECGIRLVKANNDAEELEVLLELEATFVADYQSEQVIDNDEISDFGEKYVGFHVWPYWRELVQSSLTKTGLPAVSIPAFRIEAA